MEYRIEEKKAFKVMGFANDFSYENANAAVPKFWNEVFADFAKKGERPVKGMYGVCFDEDMKGNQFRYMIADDFDESVAKKHSLSVHEIKAHTWAVFPCRGAMPLPLQELNKRIFSEWLPASSYEIAEGYNIEFYSDPSQFKNGMQDAEYYSEIWIPVNSQSA